MTTRRELLGLLGSLSATALVTTPAAALANAGRSISRSPQQGDQAPTLAPGAPDSPQRRALIDTLASAVEGLETRFEPHTHRSASGTMPYRLFRPQGSGPFPLVVYLHGGAGIGDDNQRQMGAGNVLGTRVWALAEHQRRFPSFVLVPQTSTGWVRSEPRAPGDSVRVVAPGLGEGARLALELIDALRRELPIDERRLYLTGQSMGGGGAWHLIAQRPNLFAAAVICCGTPSLDDPVAANATPLWNFHGDVDPVVPVSASRDRIAAMRRAGGRPISTEYAGVAHDVWRWAYSEPALLPWLFSKRRAG